MVTETWLPFCVKRLGPAWKQGYPGVPDRTLAEIEGEVDHSMEGYRGGAYAVLDGPAQSSWPFSIYRDGPPEQHYPLEAITWHAGLPGDRRTDTSLIGNLTLVGKEHEGLREDLTPSQLEWSVRISQAIRELCPRVGATPPALRVNLFEHNWLSATSCPSGRIPWQTFIAKLEDDMATLAELEADLKELRSDATRADNDLRAAVAKLREDATRGDNEMRARLDMLESRPSSGSYTDDDARQAVKERL